MGWFRQIFAPSTSPESMETPSSAGRFSVDVPPEILEAWTEGGAIAPRVRRDTALQVPAVLRSRNLICGTLASLPHTVHGPDRREVDNQYLLGGNIDPDLPNSVMLAMTYEDLLFESVAWWRVTGFGWHGYPVSAMWVPADAVHVAQTDSLLPSQTRITPDQWIPRAGQVYIDGVPVSDRELIRFDSPNPPLLRHAARAIRSALALDRAAARFSDEPAPLGVFTPKDGVDADRSEIQDMLDEWERARAERAWGYVGAALNLDKFGWNPEELQLADARQHAVLEIARAAGIDPEDLGVSTTSRTYANSEQRRQDLLDFTLGAYVSAMQDRLSMRDVLPRNYRAKVKFEGFLRSDTKTRMETYKLGLEVGAYTQPEIRELEDKPALPRNQQPAPQRTEPVDEPVMEPAMSDHRPAVAFAVDLPAHWFAVDSPPWGSLSASDYTPEQWRRACLIDTGEGDVDSKSRYKLPVKTPGGAVHRGGVHAAAGGHGLGAVKGVSAEKKAAAARALVRIYRADLDEEPPESLRRMAGASSSNDSGLQVVVFDDADMSETFQVDRENRIIQGLAVPWNVIGTNRIGKWRFEPDSLRWSETSRIKLNRYHERRDLIGRATRLQSGSRGLMSTWKVADTPEGRQALSLAADKILDGLSIEVDFDDDFGDEWVPDSSDKSLRVVKQATLRACALTGSPAFDEARVDRVAADRYAIGDSSDGYEGNVRPRPTSGRALDVRVRPRYVRRRSGEGVG